MRPAVNRFAERMEQELVKHEGEKDPAYTEIDAIELHSALVAQAAELRSALNERKRAKTPRELALADEKALKHAAHAGNFAMFIYDNLSLMRHG